MTNGNKAEARAHNADKPCKTDRNVLINSGVCANCAYQDECGILAETSVPIIQCELYQCCSLPTRELAVKEPPTPKTEKRSENVHLLGLCANCDNRADCKLPKSSSGVWHCEEYR